MQYACKKNSILSPVEINDSELDDILRWKTGDTIFVGQDLYLDNVELIIEPGVMIKIKHGCNIIIGSHGRSKISAVGTPEQPINFIVWNPDNDPKKNYWGGITIISHSSVYGKQRLEYCNFIKGGCEGTYAVIANDARGLKMDHCQILYSKNLGIMVSSGAYFDSFQNNTIKYTQGHPISIPAESAYSIGTNNQIWVDSPGLGIHIWTHEINLIGASVVWNKQTVPYIISSLSLVNYSTSMGTLSLEAGTVIKLEERATIKVRSNCCLKAKGSLEKRVIFTSLNNTPAPGNWKYIAVHDEASVDFDNCVFEYGGFSDQSASNQAMFILNNVEQSSFENCIFRFSEGPAIMFYQSGIGQAGFTKFSNNVFTNLENAAISGSISAMSSIERNNQFNQFPILIQESTIEGGNVHLNKLDTEYFANSMIMIGGAETAILEIEPGVKMNFDGGGFWVGSSNKQLGKLIALGTNEEPVILTSSKQNPAHGDYSGVYFGPGTVEGSILKNCMLNYGGNINTAEYYSSIKIIGFRNSVTIENCAISYSRGYGILISGGANPYLINNSYFDNLQGEVLYYNN
jgi:hypothetical protein